MADEQCLQPSFEGYQWWRRDDVIWQTVPNRSCGDCRGAVADGDVTCWWNMQLKCQSGTESTAAVLYPPHGTVRLQGMAEPYLAGSRRWALGVWTRCTMALVANEGHGAAAVGLPYWTYELSSGVLPNNYFWHLLTGCWAHCCCQSCCLSSRCFYVFSQFVLEFSVTVWTMWHILFSAT